MAAFGLARPLCDTAAVPDMLVEKLSLLAWAGIILLFIWFVRRVFRAAIDVRVQQRLWAERMPPKPTPWPAPPASKPICKPARQWRPAGDFWRETLRREPRPGRPTANLAELARRLDLDPDYLRRFVPEYREATIPKRRGGGRTLLVPDKPTKALQRRVLRRLLSALEPHPAAVGFRRGKSIVDHAATHAGGAILLKCDVIDFFGATLGTRANALFRRLGWDDEAAAVLTKIACRGNALPQGAATSPALSNLVNRGLDAKLALRAARIGMRYSRYADDLCFSYATERPTSARRVRGMLQYARRTCRAYGYTLHGKQKTQIVRSYRRQLVCGLVVNDRPNLPRETRRRLRAIRHHVATGRPATLTAEQLAGWAAYEKMIFDGPKPT